MFNYTTAEMIRRCTPGKRATQSAMIALAEARGAFRERQLNPERLPLGWRDARSMVILLLNSGWTQEQIMEVYDV